VGQLPTDKGPEWMGICHHEQDISPPSKFVFCTYTRGWLTIIVPCVNIIVYVLCKYKRDPSVQVKKNMRGVHHHHAFNFLEASSW
jgi:hypothetical protein